MSRVFIRLKFNDDGVISQEDLKENMMEIPEVDMISIKAYDDVPVGSEPESEEEDEDTDLEPPPRPKTRSVRKPTPALEPTPAPVKKPRPAPRALSFFEPRPEEMKRGR